VIRRELFQHNTHKKKNQKKKKKKKKLVEIGSIFELIAKTNSLKFEKKKFY